MWPPERRSFLGDSGGGGGDGGYSVSPEFPFSAHDGLSQGSEG